VILGQPLVPKNADGILRVIIPGRISTPQQDLEAIASQQEDAERWLRQVYTGPIEVRRLGEQASGMLAIRESMVEAEELINTGEQDLVLASELREIYRNPRFQWAFVQDCIDHDTRVICVADNIDTGDENWEVMMHAAALRHGMAVPESRRRVRRKATYSFSRGGMVLKIRYGYRKLSRDEALSGQFGPKGLRVTKLPECTPVIRAMCERILRGASATAVADWLNEEGIAPGPYVSSGKWTHRLVVALLRDPILSGTRTFRKVVHKQVYGTGRHRRLPNMEGPEMQVAPELAHLLPQEQAEVIAVLDARGKDQGRGVPAGKDSPLWNKPRSRSPWPGQHAVCSACSGLMYRSGAHLRCQNTTSASTRTCWNHVQVEMAFVFAKMIPWLAGVLDQYPGFRIWMAAVAWQEMDRTLRRKQRSSHAVDQRVADLKAQAKTLAQAIRKGGKMTSLLEELAEVEAACQQAQREQQQFLEEYQAVGTFTSPEDVARRLDEALLQMARTSLDFADLLRRLVPEFVIVPVQALGCPQVRPRAKLTLRLDAWTVVGEALPPPVSVVLDLFKLPEYIQHLDRCVAARRAQPNATLRELAAELHINYMTVKRALDYHRKMQHAGWTEPYRELTKPPAQASRWKERSEKDPGAA
jgi:DNA invertase Pin-like site-specific DNA recombinase